MNDNSQKDPERKKEPSGKDKTLEKLKNTNRLVPLSSYITGMWKLGGLPLVLVGIGAANIFVPTVAGYSETEQYFVTVFLFFSGLLAWGATVQLAYKRWQLEVELSNQRDKAVIDSICKIATSVESDAAAKARVEILTDAIQSLDYPKVQAPDLGTVTRPSGDE